ncbi:MAG: KdsC family phosphatase [Lysobacterales bacterium]
MPQNPACTDLHARARRVRLACFDVDGVLTDGRLWMNDQGVELKGFHAHDGLGLKRLRERGIEVALISARRSECVSLRAQELGIHLLFQGQTDKLACFEQLLLGLQLHADQAAYTGDDLPDLPVLQCAGLAIAVANAVGAVKTAAHWITEREGGNAAVREICELILAAQQPGPNRQGALS